MLGFLKKLFGTKHDRDVKGVMPLVEQINAEYAKLSSLSHDQLRAKTTEFRERIKTHLKPIQDEIDALENQVQTTTDVYKKQAFFDKIDLLIKERDKACEEVLLNLLPEAFAVVKEASKRLTENEEIVLTASEHDRNIAKYAAEKGDNFVRIDGDKAIWKNNWMAAGNEVKWNMVHYDVQLIGGIVLHQGKVSEMATGEGKTLVATLPAYLNGLSGFGVHIVTVNNYLAKRDSEWNGPLFQFLGLTVDCIDLYQPNSNRRRQAYSSDIVYGTNNEFGFDYLRDNMVHTKNDRVQGKFHFAMVDEVDSVLIDDARTPLIISGPTGRDVHAEQFMFLKPRIELLLEKQKTLFQDYFTTAKKQIEAGNSGVNEGEGGLALLRAFRALPKNRALIKYLSEPGIQTIMRKAENHYLSENKRNLPKVDEPLYFVIDEKQRSVDLRSKGIESLTQQGEDPNLFILPDLGAMLADIENNTEMSLPQKAEAKDTAINSFSERSEMIHSIDQMLKAYTLFNKDDEYVIMDDEVKIVDEQTGRILDGRRYSDGLHQALEAKEGVKIEAATQTYATVTLQNYFRMYHKLCGMTGTAETEAHELWEIYKLDVVSIPTNRSISRSDLEDLIYKTDKEKYNAVIDEIDRLTKAGRPVLVGTTSVQISELLARMLTLRKIPHNVLNAKHHQREAEIVQTAGQSAQVTIATNMAGRGTDIKLGEGVKAAGGLAIIGTERHQSRRVDRQLRGRAGRQGDPGSSQFFISLEDPLMRLFGSERISGMMDRLGHQEGDILQHSMLTKSVERAQKKVEENNFGIRKRLLEYDDVMNIQRSAIYKMRNNALDGERLSIDLNDMFFQLGFNIIRENRKISYESFKVDLYRYFSVDDLVISETEFNDHRIKDNELANKLHDHVMEHYSHRNKALLNLMLPNVAEVYENEKERFTNIAFPISDGHRHLELVFNMEESLKSEGQSVIDTIQQMMMLSVIDNNWKHHLRAMDELKDNVQMASFEQKDPLVIYKKAAYQQFEGLISEVQREVASFLFQWSIPMPSAEELEAIQQQALYEHEQRQKLQEREMQQLHTNFEEVEMPNKRLQEAPQQQSKQPIPPFVNIDPKVGRNDNCPCGSGKKFKQCHGKNL